MRCICLTLSWVTVETIALLSMGMHDGTHQNAEWLTNAGNTATPSSTFAVTLLQWNLILRCADIWIHSGSILFT